ncbi:uncharacterized protein LOC111376345 isoform X2 [Olea europaea var. sylvestris]|uniref:uncharacterized protein LOC111376345 isoform X2 n=1 Tax=Olea europaea var. sylvestris TaxID=158386 RepID=UPI000C1CEAEA|nr:uncharacterized protein LOC111376345 isoform X2 [Olea europaea var. sylvestris]
MQTTECWSRIRYCNLQSPVAFRFFANSTYSCRKKDICGHRSLVKFSISLCRGYKANVRAFAGQKQKKSLKRLVKIRKGKNIQPDESVSLEIESASRDDRVQDDILTSSSDNLEVQNSFAGVPSRNAVLQACTVTSSLIGALGILIRQVSHVASTEGLPIIDCSKDITFSFELSHLLLITELVILVSSCRYLLLKTWTDFAKSSEAANRQVLTSLEPLDYIIVAFLPGVSEVNLVILCVNSLHIQNMVLVSKTTSDSWDFYRNFFSVALYYLFLAAIGRVSSQLQRYLGYCIWEVVENTPLQYGLHLLQLHMVMLRLYLQVSWYQWLLMHLTT